MSAMAVAVVQGIDASLRADGSRVELAGMNDGVAVVKYTKGQNDECETCIMSDEDLSEFILGALRNRSIAVDRVDVVPG